MRLVSLVLMLTLVVGFLAGGRLTGLAQLRPRWAPLAIGGLALQTALPADWFPVAALFVSFVLLIAFCVVNLATPGFLLLLAGTLMNFAVIGVNQGMPVGQAALVDSGQVHTLADLVHNGGAKHHLAGPDDRLLFLADVIPIPPPIRQAVSAGDVVAYAGVSYLVLVAMLADRRRLPADVAVVGTEGVVDG
jgi:Family of unknown function (DUF5317)